MKSKTNTFYSTALSFLLLPALRLYGCHRHDLSKTLWRKPPAGSVAPLY
jgi:hypothetical protein